MNSIIKNKDEIYNELLQRLKQAKEDWCNATNNLCLILHEANTCFKKEQFLKLLNDAGVYLSDSQIKKMINIGKNIKNGQSTDLIKKKE